MTQARHRQASGIGFGLAAAVIWGGYLAVSRQGIAAGLRPVDLAFLRYGTAAVLLVGWLLRREPYRLAGIGWRRGIILALLAGPLFVLIGAGGYMFAPLAHGAVIQLGALTLMGIVLAALVLGEQLGPARIVGTAVIVAGLATIAGPALFAGAGQAWIGDLMFACAGTMWAVFTALVRRWRVPPFTATAVVSVLSGALYAPAYLAIVGLGRLAAASLGLLAEQVLVQGLLSGIVALFAFSRAVELLGAGRSSLFPALSPAVAILIGIPLTGEVPTPGQWLGLVIVSVGLVVAVAPVGRPAIAARSKQEPSCVPNC